MALKAATTPLVISLTEGSADAFVQGSVLTGLSGRQAYNVRAFYLEFPTPQTLAGNLSADSSIEVTITRRSKTAIPNLTDSDVLHKWSFINSLTTSGEVFFEATRLYMPDLEVPVVEETLYAQLDSSAIGVALVAIVRMDVEIDTMSDIDRLNLITRSLT